MRFNIHVSDALRQKLLDMQQVRQSMSGLVAMLIEEALEAREKKRKEQEEKDWNKDWLA